MGLLLMLLLLALLFLLLLLLLGEAAAAVGARGPGWGRLLLWWWGDGGDVADGSDDRLLEALVVALGAGDGAYAVAAGAKDARGRAVAGAPLLEGAGPGPCLLARIAVLGVAGCAGDVGSRVAGALGELAVVGAGAVGRGLERRLAGVAVFGYRRRGRGRRRGLLLRRRRVVGGDGAYRLGLLAVLVLGSLVGIHVDIVVVRQDSLCGLGRTHLPPVPSLLVHGCGPLLCLVLFIDTRQAAQLLQQVAVALRLGRGQRSGALRDWMSVPYGASHASLRGQNGLSLGSKRPTAQP